MKHPTQRLVALLAVLTCTCLIRLSAAPVILGGDDLLGTVSPATPANETNALEQVSYLVEAYNLGTADGTTLPSNPDDAGGVYKLYRPTGAPDPLAAPALFGGSVGGPNPELALGGFMYEYVLFFQANSAWVYYIGDIAGSNSIKWGGDPVPFPASNVNGSEISHYVLFNQKPDVVIDPHNNVPEGGTTILLLGSGLLLMALKVRQKKNA